MELRLSYVQAIAFIWRVLLTPVFAAVRFPNHAVPISLSVLLVYNIPVVFKYEDLRQLDLLLTA